MHFPETRLFKELRKIQSTTQRAVDQYISTLHSLVRIIDSVWPSEEVAPSEGSTKVLEAEDPDGLAPTARLQELEVEAIAEHAAKLYRKRTLGDSPRDTDAMKRIAQFFAKVVPEGLDQIRRIVEGPSTVNDKLLALEQLGVIGGEGGRIFSANELAYLLGVDPSTIKKTTYWRRLMAAKREHENQAVEESTRKHRDRAKITETFPSTGD